ncbi:MAG: chemotaxis protein CheW [Candidatus Tectimicrobiota bacterium]
MQPHNHGAHDSQSLPGLPQRRMPFVNPRGVGLTRAEGARLRFGVRVGPYHLLIAPDTLSEVVLRPELYPLPNMPHWFLGLLNQRGNVLPVFALHPVLRLSGPAPAQRTVLVFDQGSDAVGMSIDALPQSVRLEQQIRQLPPLPALLAAHVGAAYSAAKHTWLEFQHAAFFTALVAHTDETSPLPAGA